MSKSEKSYHRDEQASAVGGLFIELNDAIARASEAFVSSGGITNTDYLALLGAIECTKHKLVHFLGAPLSLHEDKKKQKGAPPWLNN